MVEVRRALEAEVAVLAAERRSSSDLIQIQRAAGTLEQAVWSGGDGVNEDVALHRAIADAAQNQFLISTLLVNADPVKARKAATRHMDNTIKRIEPADRAFWQQEGVKLASPLV